MDQGKVFVKMQHGWESVYPEQISLGDEVRLSSSAPLTQKELKILLKYIQVLLLRHEHKELTWLWESIALPVLFDEELLQVIISTARRLGLVETDNPKPDIDIKTQMVKITGNRTTKNSFTVLVGKDVVLLAPRLLAYLLRLVVALYENTESDGFLLNEALVDEYIMDGVAITEDTNACYRWKKDVESRFKLYFPSKLIEASAGRQRLLLNKGQIMVDKRSFKHLYEYIEQGMTGTEATTHYLKVIMELVRRLPD